MRRLIRWLSALLLLLPLASMAQLQPWPKMSDSVPGATCYFYKNYGYGSQAIFNPVTNFINAGYDILQLSDNDNRIFIFPYGRSAKNVFINLGRPDKAIKDVGVWKWVRTEVLPLTFKTEGMQWVPNYFLHMMGGGMYYVSLTEWYRNHQVRQPKLIAILTLTAGELMNEVTENQGYEGTNADPIADVYIFNIAGIVMFTSPKVCRFFSEQLNMADWSLQPTITIPNASLQNAGQYFSMKYALPFYKPLRLFGRFGMSTLLGLSYRFNNGYSVSIGGGIRPNTLRLLDIKGRQVTIDSKLSGGIFLDKDNSLMASLVVSDVPDYFITANVYPGLLKLGKFTPGLWAAVGKTGYVTFGINTVYTFGVGIGGEVNAGY